MAVSTIVGGIRTLHRAARVGDNAFQGALSLDWANGQVLALSGSSQVSAIFDALNERIVYVSIGGASTVLGGWITVGTLAAATAAVAAGSMWIASNGPPIPILVSPNLVIAGLQGGAAGTLSMIPATFGSG